MFDEVEKEIQVADNTDNTVETAAKRGSSSYATPLDQVKYGFIQIVLNAHTTFRYAVVAALMSSTAREATGFDSVEDALGFSIVGATGINQAVPTARLGTYATIKTGNGQNEPFSTNFREDFFNVDSEVAKNIKGFLPPELEKGMSLENFVSMIDAYSPDTQVATALEQQFSVFKEKYIDTLDDLVTFTISSEIEEFGTSDNQTLRFKFSIAFDGSIYKEVVKAEKFQPYLLWTWIHNNFGTERRGITIIDPMTAVNQSASMVKFAQPRIKVNEDGFAFHGSGMPIFIPPNANAVETFINTANTCVDENGTFVEADLLEKHKLANRIIYVDWVNDIMAYTTSTGKIATLNLGGVHPLDKASEFTFLSTPLQSRSLRTVRQIISRSIAGTEAADAIKNVSTSDPDSASVINVLNSEASADIFTKVLTTFSGLEGREIVKIYHLAGYKLDDYEDNPVMIVYLKALRAIMKLLKENIGKDMLSSLALESKQKNLALLYRLIGVEYILQKAASGTSDYVASCAAAHKIEREKTKVDLNKRTFDVPNVVIGPGFNGFLPHQGRLISCTEKVPTTGMFPVQTGGGKTIFSTVTAIKILENVKTFPMITTKGNLIKGTITEINAITKGKINAIPFTPAVIRAMKKNAGITTFALFLKWYKSLPPNTLLVNSYSNYASKRKLFEDLQTVDGFVDAPIYTNQYLLVIKLLGIRAFIGDESHIIKNPESARSRNSYSAFSQADIRMIMSGTMVSNTVVDLVGQTRAISPGIFGDDPEAFADNHNVSLGLLKDDEDARIIKDRMKETTAYHEATREEWSYMLPLREDVIKYAMLTEKQQIFYDLLMQEAYSLIVEAEKNKSRNPKPSDDDGDDEDGDDDDGDDEDEEEVDEDAALVAKAKIHLQRVEMFLVAPDEDEEYVAWEGLPTGEDLISQKIRLIDQQIEAHITKNKDNLTQNKIIIFGWNKAASRHYMKHSAFARRTLHYTAGNDEVLRRYETDNSVIIMAADEVSVREGFNLQMTGLILRQQSVWAPGDHEQTLARMYRPDPRGKYNRDSVNHTWVMTALRDPNRPSLDAIKMARLTSKFISNARLTFEGKPEWRRVSAQFDDMEMLKMRLELIFAATADDINPYLENWDVFIDWENDINATSKRRLAEQLEARFNVDLVDEKGKIKDINQFIKLAMSEVTSSKDIPGSKQVWVPWTANAIPADPKNWGFSVLGGQDVPIGTVVYTSFGPGIITSNLKKGIKVQLHNGKIMGFRKNIVMLVSKDKYKELTEVVKNPTKWAAASMNPWGEGSTTSPTAPDIKGATDDEEMEVLDTLEDLGADDEDLTDFDVVATIINGWPALLINADLPQLKNVTNWRRVDPYTSMSFRSWDACKQFLTLLDSKLHIDSDTFDALEDEIEEFKSGKSLVLGKQIAQDAVRQFFNAQHKKLGKVDGKYSAKPYFIAVDKTIKLAFDTDSHDPKVISYIKNAKTKITGIKSIQSNDAFWVNIFTTVKKAQDDLEFLSNVVNIDATGLRIDLDSVKEDILDLKKTRARPSL